MRSRPSTTASTRSCSEAAATVRSPPARTSPASSADEAGDVRAGGERTVAAASEHDRVDAVVEGLERIPERVDDPAVDGVDGRVVEPDGLDHCELTAAGFVSAGRVANISRSSVLRNFPTLVFGISAMNSYRSGSHHRAKFG